jgi:DNA-binding transcriptional LysR family regulator
MPYDPADLIHREAATAWGRSRPCAPHRREGGSNGSNAMRSVLALGLLIALCASANAARVHHFKPRHVIVRPRQGLPLGSAIPGWAYAPPRPPVHYDDTPSYDDPSKFGG